MRVLIAPDRFADTLSAVEAARAIAAGWGRRAPADDLEAVPMTDGGPGFCEALHATLGGDLLAVTVPGPYGDPVPGTVLLAGETGYVEAAQACGLHLTAAGDVEQASSRGVGELVLAATRAGARSVVVGLAGVGTNDGGAGLLSALGAVCDVDGALDHGPAGLASVERVDVAPAREAVGDVHMVAALDVDSPLLGLIGTTNVHGGRRGVPEERKQAVDLTLERLASAAGRKLASAKGAGAGGGLGYALMLLGAAPEPALPLVSETLALLERAQRADLVVTGEAAFDFSSRSGTVPYAVAEVAARALQPCIALAGEVLVGAREMRALGIESAYAVADLPGQQPVTDHVADPAAGLAALAERVARTWSR
ncbi:MAG TPA: glycerate kinase [Nocardioidaceae bacterium]|jgi:glycerate kinase